MSAGCGFGVSAGVGISGGRRGYDYYVDSVNGDDGNNGLSSSTAFETIAAVLAVAAANEKIGLARGSHWRESLDLHTTAGVTVGAYGTGAKPLLDCSDTVANASFSKTAEQTNVYQVTMGTGGTATDKVSAWEDDVRLTRVADVAAVDATAGTFYVDTDNDIVYLHASDSSDVTANAKVYEISQRMAGLWLGNSANVNGVHTCRNVGGNGSMEVGSTSNVRNCLCTEGHKHNFLIASGLVEDTICYANERTTSTGAATLFVSYASTGTGLSTTFRRCFAVGDVDPRAGGNTGTLGFYAHTTSGSYTAVRWEQCGAHNVAQPWACENVLAVTAEDFDASGFVNQLPTWGAATQTCTMDGGVYNTYYANDTDADNRSMSANGTLTMTDVGIIVKATTGICKTRTATVTNCTLVLIDLSYPASGGNNLWINASNYNYTFNRNIVYSKAKTGTNYWYPQANMNGAPATTVADYNDFSPNFTCWYKDGEFRANVAAYKAAYETLDVHSITDDPEFSADPRTGDLRLDAESPANAIQAGIQNFLTLTDWTALVAALP